MIPVQRPCLGAEELRLVAGVFESRWLGLGAVTKSFEDRLSGLVGVSHVVGVNSGTSALHLALDAIGLGAGDEVIVPSLTFVATAQAIAQTGAEPVFCEVRPDTLNIDLDDAFDRVTPRTRAFVPVHYGGLACDMDPLLTFARDRSLRVIEDAAHAFGSTYKGRPIGGFGDVACFSFDPIKNITCGEGGAVATNDAELAERMRRARVLGIDNDTWSRYRNERNWFYHVAAAGYRYHLPNLNAAIGLAQLDRMETFRARKCAIVRRYDEELDGVDGLALVHHDLHETFPFFYVVRVLGGRRDAVMTKLKDAGVGTGVHYIPNHLQPFFAGRSGRLPVTEQIFEEILTLPLFVEMTDEEQSLVIAQVRRLCGSAA